MKTIIRCFSLLLFLISFAAVGADGPCFDNQNRYVDCGNGTVTDTVTGMIWLKQADCLGIANYADANNAAARLKHGMCGLKDHSSPGDWRLPTKSEWDATIAQATALNCTGFNAPSLTNTAGEACYSAGQQQFSGVQSIFYWSSSSVAVHPFVAWLVALDAGSTTPLGRKDLDDFTAWPVRTGK